jgi:hypothetical protein
MGEKIIIENNILEKLKNMEHSSKNANIVLKQIIYDDNIFKNFVYSNSLSLYQINLLKRIING